MLGQVFVHAGRNQLLHAELHLAFLGIDADDEDFHDLADAEDFSGHPDAFFRADFADVDHAFDAFRKLHERAKLCEAGDWPFRFRAQPETLRNLDQRISQSLLESEGDTMLRRVNAEDHRFDGLTGLHYIAGLANLAFVPG